MTFDQRLYEEVASQPYPLLFITVSGAHLYGFPSPDSDYDLRGVHILPAREVVGLETGPETIDATHMRDHVEIDLVSHDVKKFFGLMLKKNGYVLEQIVSPLVIHTTPEHAELQAIVPHCITRHHFHHYAGFAENQWRLFGKETPHRVKPLLYVLRVLLTGTYLMRTGIIETNLSSLNATFQLPYIPDLIARKLAGPEQALLTEADMALYQREFARLRGDLEAARDASTLPEAPTWETKAALHALLVRLRLDGLATAQTGAGNA